MIVTWIGQRENKKTKPFLWLGQHGLATTTGFVIADDLIHLDEQVMKCKKETRRKCQLSFRILYRIVSRFLADRMTRHLHTNEGRQHWTMIQADRMWSSHRETRDPLGVTIVCRPIAGDPWSGHERKQVEYFVITGYVNELDWEIVPSERELDLGDIDREHRSCSIGHVSCAEILEWAPLPIGMTIPRHSHVESRELESMKRDEDQDRYFTRFVFSCSSRCIERLREVLVIHLTFTPIVDSYSLLIWLLISHVFYLICCLESTSSKPLFREKVSLLLSRDTVRSDVSYLSWVLSETACRSYRWVGKWCNSDRMLLDDWSKEPTKIWTRNDPKKYRALRCHRYDAYCFVCWPLNRVFIQDFPDVLDVEGTGAFAGSRSSMRNEYGWARSDVSVPGDETVELFIVEAALWWERTDFCSRRVALFSLLFEFVSLLWMNQSHEPR